MVEIVGGPYCGSQLAPRQEAWVWVGGPQDKPRGYRASGGKRLLYRRAQMSGRDCYVFAHHTYRQCGGCRGFTSVERCPFCGSMARA